MTLVWTDDNGDIYGMGLTAFNWVASTSELRLVLSNGERISLEPQGKVEIFAEAVRVFFHAYPEQKA